MEIIWEVIIDKVESGTSSWIQERHLIKMDNAYEFDLVGVIRTHCVGDQDEEVVLVGAKMLGMITEAHVEAWVPVKVSA